MILFIIFFYHESFCCNITTLFIQHYLLLLRYFSRLRAMRKILINKLKSELSALRDSIDSSVAPPLSRRHNHTHRMTPKKSHVGREDAQEMKVQWQ